MLSPFVTLARAALPFFSRRLDRSGSCARQSFSSDPPDKRKEKLNSKSIRHDDERKAKSQIIHRQFAKTTKEKHTESRSTRGKRGKKRTKEEAVGVAFV
jgi:hypothetical protein